MNDGTKFFARLSWLPQGAPKKKYSTIPGLYESPAAAVPVEALVAATERYKSSGADAVWPKGLPGAAGLRARGEMRRTGRHTVLPWSRRLQKGQRRRLHVRAAEAQRSKKGKKRDANGQCASTVLPAERSQVINATMREFLQPAMGPHDVLGQPQVPTAPTPIPMPEFARAAAALGVDITAEMGIPSA